MADVTFRYWKNLAQAFDQGVNALIGGWCDETCSAASYRMREQSRFRGWVYRCINRVFWLQSDHCRGAYRDEVERRQLPPEYRSTVATSPTQASG